MEKKTIRIPNSEYKQRPHITYYLGDVHEGAANQTTAQFKKAVAMIACDGDAWVGVGDYIDAINYHDPRFNPCEISQDYGIRDLSDLPRAQCDRFIHNIAPIADKCIGLISGNHEDAYKRHNTFDCTQYICDAIKADNLKHKAWISLTFFRKGDKEKTCPVKIVVCHGAGGGGMREGYPINKVYDVFRWDMADVHVMGHLHQMATDRATYHQYTNDVLRADNVWFASNGCFLAKSAFGNDGYFEQKPGKESAIGLIRQSIYPSTHDKSQTRIILEPVYL